MSHELRTPLNGIIGFAEFLVDGKPGTVNPKQKEYLEDILDSGKHLLQLINDVLDLAKVEAGKMELNPEKFSLGKAIEEVCAVSKPMRAKEGYPSRGGGRARVRLRHTRPAKIQAGPLQPALQRGQIHGRRRQGGNPCRDARRDRFKLAVQDTGIGIKTEDIVDYSRSSNKWNPARRGVTKGQGSVWR